MQLWLFLQESELVETLLTIHLDQVSQEIKELKLWRK
jgi:hypothetical protein